eukprot:SAG11_NODE_1603_length_4599_cov_12.027111_1_plen_80_part_00
MIALCPQSSKRCESAVAYRQHTRQLRCVDAEPCLIAGNTIGKQWQIEELVQLQAVATSEHEIDRDHEIDQLTAATSPET